MESDRRISAISSDLNLITFIDYQPTFEGINDIIILFGKR